MAVDRSKYKATSVATLNAKDKELETQLGTKRNSDFHKFDSGRNVFRIYPAHMDSKSGLFAEAKVTTFIPAMVADRNDKGEEVKDSNGKTKMKEGVRQVFNSRIHGGTKKDLIEEYIKFAEKIAKDTYEKEDERKEKLRYIFGAFNKQDPKKSINGITYSSRWVLYADKIIAGVSNFGKLEIGKSIKERLNKIASSTDDSSEALATDPFTDVEEGRAIIVTYNKEATQPNDYYTTELDNSTSKDDRGRLIVKTYPLTDAQLEAFEAQKPLDQEYGQLFTRKDFKLQLDGLKMLDDKNELKIFQYDAFLDIIDEIDGYYPQEDEVENEAHDEVNDTVEELEENQGDEFSICTRNELKKYIVENNTGIVVKTSMTDDQIRDAIRQWKKTPATPVVDEVEELPEQVEVVEQVEETTSNTLSPQDRLAKLKANAQK